MDAADETLLAEYASSGDREALGELVSRHWARAYSISFGVLGDGASAEDTAQEAFVALIRGARRFERGRPFGPWFRTLVLNAARDAAAARKVRRRYEGSVAERRSGETALPQGEKAAIAAEIASVVGERVMQLPSDVRLPLVLHYFSGCSFEEVATIVGCPRSTAQSRIRRGLERLRDSFAGLSFVLVPLERLLARLPRVPALVACKVAVLALGIGAMMSGSPSPARPATAPTLPRDSWSLAGAEPRDTMRPDQLLPTFRRKGIAEPTLPPCL